jgi:hypothetical protein
MTGPLYTARNGLIWAFASENVRTVSEAEQALPHLLNMALTEHDEGLAESWIVRLGDLVRATREAKAQAAAKPLEIAA